MIHRADLHRELESSFSGLTLVLEEGRVYRLDREAALYQELAELFGGLTSAVDATKRGHASRLGLQREIDEFFGSLIPVVESGEERRQRATERLERSVTRLFATLELTVPAAAVAIRVMEERAREERDRRTGRRFSAFDLVRTQELDLSRIFAGLLNPMGDHSQGDLFLSLLLEELSVGSGVAAALLRDFRPARSSSVRLEYPIDGQASLPGQSITGSIDIVLEFEGNHWMGIENKPSAVDQPWQVDRYLFALAHEAEQRGGDERQVLLLYWSGDGTDPELRDLEDLTDTYWDEAKKARQRRLRARCLTVPYRKRFGAASVEGWIKRCRVECEADRVRLFLSNLLNYIQQVFTNSDPARINGG